MLGQRHGKAKGQPPSGEKKRVDEGWNKGGERAATSCVLKWHASMLPEAVSNLPMLPRYVSCACRQLASVMPRLEDVALAR